MARIGIAGAGLLGRLLAWRLAPAHEVTVFDPADGPQARGDGQGPAAFTAAGMLSPLAELDSGGPAIAALGWRSLPLWRAITAALPASAEAQGPSLRTLGSLLVAHPSDQGAAQRVLARLAQAPANAAAVPQRLDRAALAALEPALAPHLHAWLLPGEGQILPQAVLPALCEAATGVRWRWGSAVASVAPGCVALADGRVQRFDLAIDVRGTGARPALPVRGVRGEVVVLHAPGVLLQRPVRLLHARHRVYLVPRPGDRLMVGASEVESEDRSPVSLRSAVELMAAAHSVLPELAEARIVHLETNLRPALPDNGPHTEHAPGLLRINGLYRHGWLLAPALVQDALAAAGLAPAEPAPALEARDD